MNITKADLSRSLASSLNLNMQDAKILVDNFFEEIMVSLEKNSNVKISGFGTFNIRDKQPRPGNNLQTGESMLIDRRRVVTFKQGLRLKEIVQAKEIIGA